MPRKLTTPAALKGQGELELIYRQANEAIEEECRESGFSLAQLVSARGANAVKTAVGLRARVKVRPTVPAALNNSQKEWLSESVLRYRIACVLGPAWADGLDDLTFED